MTPWVKRHIHEGVGKAYALLRHTNDMEGAREMTVALLRSLADDIEARRVTPEGVAIANRDDEVIE